LTAASITVHTPCAKHQRHQAGIVLREQFAEPLHLLLTPDEAGEWSGQVMLRLPLFKLAERRLFPLFIAKNIRLQLRKFEQVEGFCSCIDGSPVSQYNDNSRYFFIKQTGIVRTI